MKILVDGLVFDKGLTEEDAKTQLRMLRNELVNRVDKLRFELEEAELELEDFTSNYVIVPE